ncbi:lipocalin-like domain-containing protein [uncultured Brevundimonas sp.]|uniref:lipocalin-like domain-containing protein n=1 Tax=uncultured Brevundimonas sp. TaxID=213418 RepID=UPI0025F936E9|nr:lipocalin-like domain-containing protein [uncultured Brevundimonas sp.]
MPTARLMTTPADFKTIGIEPGVVHQWEDGRRDTDAAGHNEVWYFDATLDDGTKIVVGFRPKMPGDLASDNGSPNLNVNITSPDGGEYVDMIVVPLADSEISHERCSVKFGPHSIEGDLKTYRVKVAPVNGVGVDLTFQALVEPYRPGGTAYVALGDNDEFYYTDMSIPKNRVTGTVTAGGKTWEVSGHGYHDHQWMNIHAFDAFHHWLWGRFYADQYTVVIYDFVATERFGFANVPIFGILDGAGKVIFDNRGPAERTLETYHDPVTNKEYPKVSRYAFRDGDTTVTFVIEWLELIEFRDVYGATDDRYGMSGEANRKAYDAKGIQPTYMRYYAKGDLAITRAGETETVSGDMIYEFNYPGKPDPRAHI